jgi:hypothetical protein
VKYLTRILESFIHGKNNYADSAVRCVIIFLGMEIIFQNIGGLLIETINKTNHNTGTIR